MPAHRLTIPDYLPPTLNRLMRGRLRDRMRLSRECRDLVMVYARMGAVPPARGPRRVSLRLVLGPRRREPDVDAPWKATLDALASSLLIRDDSPRWCRLGTLRCERGPRSMTEVELEDLES